MRIIGHMTTKNEMARWVTSTLPWLAEICHGQVAVYDDQSDDDIDELAARLGIAFSRRPQAIASFADNEGDFRWAAWQAMERALRPRDGDWVLAVDADELLVSTIPNADLALVAMQLVDSIAEAELCQRQTITFGVTEIFGFDGMGWPLQRVDGFWGDITACRLARWRFQGVFEPRKLGGGSLPSSWPDDPYPNDNLEILHLGYARAEDRIAKHERYAGKSGHNQAHIESILTEPTLRYWSGMRPPLAP